MFTSNFSNMYKTIIFVIMLILALVFIGSIVDIAIMFFGAFIISASLLPIIDKLQKYMPRTLAVSLVLLMVLIGILLVFIPLTIITVNQVALLIDSAPIQMDKINHILNFKVFNYSLLDFINSNGFENFGAMLTSFAGNILSQGLSAGKVIANSITSILMVTIMVFYLCSDTDHMKKLIYHFSRQNLKEKQKKF